MVGEEAFSPGERPVLTSPEGGGVDVVLNGGVRPAAQCPGPPVCWYSYDQLLLGTALLHPHLGSREESVTLQCQITVSQCYLPVVHCQRVPVGPVESSVVVGEFLPLTVQVVGHHVDAVQVAADLRHLVALQDDLVRGGHSRRQLQTFRLEGLGQSPAQLGEAGTVRVRSVVAVSVICGVLVVKVQPIKAVLLDKAQRMCYEPRNLGGVCQQLRILPFSGVIPTTQSQQIFGVRILFLQCCELPEEALVPAPHPSGPVGVDVDVVSLHHVMLPVQHREGVDVVSAERGVDIIHYKPAQS